MVKMYVDGWDVALHSGSGGFYAQLQLAQGIQLSNVKVYGVNSLSPYQVLRVEKVDGQFCIVGSFLSGGGSCSSKSSKKIEEPQTPPVGKMKKIYACFRSCGRSCCSKQPNRFITPYSSEGLAKANATADSNQEDASNYADEIFTKVSRGIFQDLPLNELHDIPIETVESPLYIAETLLKSLRDDNVWTNDFRFQLRHTISRLARKYLVNYILFDPVLFRANKAKLKETTDQIIKMINVRHKTKRVDLGVKAELSIIKSLIGQLTTNQRWWQTIIQDASIIFQFKSTKNPSALLKRILTIIDEFRDLIVKDKKVERSLLIDQLYVMKAEDVIICFTSIVQCDNNWETRFMALSYLEWAIYRKIFTTDQISGFEEVLEWLTHLNIKKLNQKLLTIFLKLREIDLFENLFETVKQQVSQKYLEFINNLQLSSLAPETKYGAVTNLKTKPVEAFGIENEVILVTEKLMEQKYVSIVGLPGIGKSTLALRVAQSQISNFEVIWECKGQTEQAMEASLKELAEELGIDINVQGSISILKQKLKNKKVLLLIDNPTIRLDDQLLEWSHEVKASILLTSRNLLCRNAYLPPLWSIDIATEFMMGLLKVDCNTYDVKRIVEELSCIPLALKVASSFVNERGTEFAIQMLDKNIMCFEYDETHFIKMVIQSTIKVIDRIPDAKYVLCLSALLSPNPVHENIFYCLAESIKPNLDVVQSIRTAMLYSLINSSGGSINMNQLVKKAILSKYADIVNSIIPKLVSKVEELRRNPEINKQALRICTSNIMRKRVGIE